MAEGTYEYECMRAELLGIDKPDYDTFVKEKELKETATKEIEDETIDTEKLKVYIKFIAIFMQKQKLQIETIVFTSLFYSTLFLSLFEFAGMRNARRTNESCYRRFRRD